MVKKQNCVTWILFTFNYELNRSLPKQKKKVIGLVKDESGGKNHWTKRAKTYR